MPLSGPARNGEIPGGPRGRLSSDKSHRIASRVHRLRYLFPTLVLVPWNSMPSAAHYIDSSLGPTSFDNFHCREFHTEESPSNSVRFLSNTVIEWAGFVKFGPAHARPWRSRKPNYSYLFYVFLRGGAGDAFNPTIFQRLFSMIENFNGLNSKRARLINAQHTQAPPHTAPGPHSTPWIPEKLLVLKQFVWWLSYQSVPDILGSFPTRNLYLPNGTAMRGTDRKETPTFHTSVSQYKI